MGGKQLGFSNCELTTAKKQSTWEKFPAEMEAAVPWQALIALIEPHSSKASKEGDRPPHPLAAMLRIHQLMRPRLRAFTTCLRRTSWASRSWRRLQAHLSAWGMTMRQDTTVDATLIAGCQVAKRPGKRRGLPDTPEGRLQDPIGIVKTHSCSRAGHPFRVIKQPFGFLKTRLHGLFKKRCKINVLAAHTNLLMARRQSLATG